MNICKICKKKTNGAKKTGLCRSCFLFSDANIGKIKKGERRSIETEFKKGQVGINKGKKLSAEWIKNISKSHKGIIPVTAFKKGNKIGTKTLEKWRKNGGKPWNKGKPWIEKRGKNHPNWKGGQPYERDLLKGRWEYVVWRLAVFTRDDYTCQICGIKGGRLNADHIKPWSLFPELRYAIDNGRTLCKECHRKTDTYGYRLNKFISNDKN